MKSALVGLGIILIILGGLSLAYQGFTYTQREKVAQVGNLQLTSDTQHTVYFPPLLGGAGIVAGIILVVVGRRGGGK